MCDFVLYFLVLQFVFRVRLLGILNIEQRQINLISDTHETFQFHCKYQPMRWIDPRVYMQREPTPACRLYNAKHCAAAN